MKKINITNDLNKRVESLYERMKFDVGELRKQIPSDKHEYRIGYEKAMSVAAYLIEQLIILERNPSDL